MQLLWEHRERAEQRPRPPQTCDSGCMWHQVVLREEGKVLQCSLAPQFITKLHAGCHHWLCERHFNDTVGTEGRSREQEAGQPHLNPWKGDAANPPGSHFKTRTGQEDG